MNQLKSASGLAVAGLAVLVACGPRIEKAHTADSAMGTSAPDSMKKDSMPADATKKDPPAHGPMMAASPGVSTSRLSRSGRRLRPETGQPDRLGAA